MSPGEAGPPLAWRTSLPLLVSLLLILALAFIVFHYFLLTFAVAASVALLLSPAHAMFARRLGGRNGIAAALMVGLCTIVILVPVLSYGTLITQQGLAFFEWLRPRVQPEALEKFWTQTLPARYPLLMAWVRQATDGTAMSTVSALLSRLATWANDALRLALTGLAAAFIDVTIFLMMLFFLLRDGDQLRESLRGISPLTRGQETEALSHLTNTVKGVLLAMVVVPLVQGLVALVGFLIFGVPSPLLWSLMVVFAAVIPLVGSPLAWLPAAGYLFATGATGRAVGMLLYGVLLIGLVDNIVKPLVLKGAAQIHTMLGFLSILGGLFAFGPKGFIVGPVVLSLVLSAYRIYRYDVLRWRHLPPGREGDRVPEPAEPPAETVGV